MFQDGFAAKYKWIDQDLTVMTSYSFNQMLVTGYSQFLQTFWLNCTFSSLFFIIV